MEKALTLQQVADKLGLSYHTIFMKRHEIGFRLPGSRVWLVWRVWPSTLTELSKPRNNLIRLSLRGQENIYQSAKIRNPASGGSISHHQAAKELDALLAQGTANKHKATCWLGQCGAKASSSPRAGHSSSMDNS